jgi:hypothetical protein
VVGLFFSSFVHPLRVCIGANWILKGAGIDVVMDDFSKDLGDGVVLNRMVEAFSGRQQRYTKVCANEFQKIDNINLALAWFKVQRSRLCYSRYVCFHVQIVLNVLVAKRVDYNSGVPRLCQWQLASRAWVLLDVDSKVPISEQSKYVLHSH